MNNLDTKRRFFFHPFKNFSQKNYLFFPKNHSAKKIPQKRAQLLGKKCYQRGGGEWLNIERNKINKRRSNVDKKEEGKAKIKMRKNAKQRTMGKKHF